MRQRSLPLLIAVASVGWGQLTVDQKVLDFQQTTSLYAKGYGPYDWKKKAFDVDLLDTSKWLNRVVATKNDPEFYEIMSQWAAQLNDAHVSYQLPSNFAARLNFAVDLYDGRLLVDFVNRLRLPTGEYPFVIGYELVSIDGEDATKILTRMQPYSVSANERSTRRTAAGWITTRLQAFIPDSPGVPDISTVIFRRFDGGLESYRIPWTKTGVPLTSVGKFPDLAAARVSEAGNTAMPSASGEDKPEYIELLERLQNCRISERAVINFGAVPPVFVESMPAGFVQRLGRVPSDLFYSGTFEAGGYRIGFIRIPSYGPPDQTAALTQFAREITYLQENTDGLIVDQMRNPGGSVAYVNRLLGLLFHYPWSSVGFQIRATSRWVASISSAYEAAKAQGAPREILDQINMVKQKVIEANSANRALTEPVPVDVFTIEREPAKDQGGNLTGYTKPIMVLNDEFSASAADLFAATMQDNGRAILAGWRTMGAGGSVTGWSSGSYSSGFVTMTESLMSRKYERAEAGGYPVSPYVENVGVHPEVELDYMTRENLIRRGKPFVDSFVSTMIEHLKRYQ